MNRWPVIGILGSTLLVARAEGPADPLVAAGVKEFASAYQAWDGDRFAGAASLFRQACSNAPASATAFYWLGAAQFHRMLQVRSQPASPTNAPVVDTAMEAALAALSAAITLDDRHAESHALLGTLYGMKIDGNVLRALRFGPRVDKHRRKALEYGAGNPRVQYLLGTCHFHTAKKPAAFREALASFQTAEKLFVAEAERPAGPLEPRWGFSSCLTFIGRTYERLDQRTQAAEYFRRALAVQPSDHYAKEGLARVTAGK